MRREEIDNTSRVAYLIRQQAPSAIACIEGRQDYPDLCGSVLFYPISGGVIMIAEIFGLPNLAGSFGFPVFGFHIHEGSSCTGNANDPFANTGGHFNPDSLPHPYHAGDLPPLFSNRGYAWQAFITSRFRIDEIIGRTIVIHSQPDDFRTQPAGNTGAKIACGVIEAN
jgi:Cu-Zn family superoxide dismutase